MPPLETAVGIDRANDRRNDANHLYGQGDACVPGTLPSPDQVNVAADRPLLFQIAGLEGHCSATVQPTAAYAALAHEQQLKVLRHAQAILRHLEFETADPCPTFLAERREMLKLARESGEVNGPTLHYALPSGLTYDLLNLAAREHKDSIEQALGLERGELDMSSDFATGFPSLEEATEHLLSLCEDEAEVIGIDPKSIGAEWTCLEQGVRPLSGPTSL